MRRYKNSRFGPPGGSAPATPPTPEVGVVAFSTTTPTLDIQEGQTGTALVQITHVSGGTFTSYAASAPVLNLGTGWCALSFVDVSGVKHLRIDVDGTLFVPEDTPVATFNVTIGNASPAVTAFTLSVNVRNDPTNDGTLLMSPSPAALSFSATEGGSQPPTQSLLFSASVGTVTDVEITAPDYGGGGFTGWVSTVETDNGNGTRSVSVACNTTNFAPGTYGASFVVSSAGLAGQHTVNITYTINPVVIPLTMQVSPTSFSFTAQEGGANPATQTLTITASGTGTLAGPVLSEPSAVSWLAEGAVGGSGNTRTSVFTVTTGVLADATYNGVVRVSDVNAVNTPIDVPVTFVVTPAPSGTFIAPPYTPPNGMTWNGATNRFDNHPLQLRYVDDEIGVWVDIDTTAHPTSGLVSTALTDTNSANFNMTLLNSWVSYHNTQGMRRGYESASGRVYRGRLTTPHNTTAGWSGLRTKGVTYDPTKTTVTRRETDGGMVLMAGTNDNSVFRTSVAGTTGGHHGRWALIGLQITADPATCGLTQNNPFHSGLVQFGSTASDQSSVAQQPVGFLMSDCCVRGVVGQYFRRGLQLEGLDMEVRATLVDEIHNSTNYGADNGITQDAQCVTAWNCGSRCWIAYSILHGGDECFNSGGGGSNLTGGECTDWFFDHVEFSANKHYLFGTANTVPPGGPYDKLTPLGSGYAFWQKKNLLETKRGHRILAQFCRLSGIRAPNNNQGYAITIKTGAYDLAGKPNPLQGSKDQMFHGCWIERCPAMMAYLVCEVDAGQPSGTTGVPANRISFTDIFGWNVDVSPYNQGSKRATFAGSIGNQNLVGDGVWLQHITNATTASNSDTSFFAYYSNMTNLTYKDSLVPWLGQGIFASNGTTSTSNGIAALDNVAPGPSHTVANLGFVPKSAGAINNYPAGTTQDTSFANAGFTNQATGDLTLTAGSRYFAGNADDASDGLNRGVSDPALVIAEIALVPTKLTAADYT